MKMRLASRLRANTRVRLHEERRQYPSRNRRRREQIERKYELTENGSARADPRCSGSNKDKKRAPEKSAQRMKND
jgi:hypothetical protein